MPTADLAERLNEIHNSLVAGSRSASRDLFVAALRPIKGHLVKAHPGLRDDDAHDLATDAILAHLREPHRYDANRASLWTYLCMRASADAIDLVRMRSRQDKLLENASQDVELWGSRANDGNNFEISIDAQTIIRMHGHRLATNEPERRVLALLLDGERSTQAFANALGLDPSHTETVAMVKQAKDRLLIRLKRLRDEF